MGGGGGCGTVDSRETENGDENGYGSDQFSPVGDRAVSCGSQQDTDVDTGNFVWLRVCMCVYVCC